MIYSFFFLLHWSSLPVGLPLTAKRSNKSMAPPPLVFDYIGAVFTAILYGKHRYCLGSDNK